MTWEGRLFLKVHDQSLLLTTINELFDVDARKSMSTAIESRDDIYFDLADATVGVKVRDLKSVEVKTCMRRQGMLEKWVKEKGIGVQTPVDEPESIREFTVKVLQLLDATDQPEMSVSNLQQRITHAKQWTMVHVAKQRWEVLLRSGETMELAGGRASLIEFD
jgi:hypothetical protein